VLNNEYLFNDTGVKKMKWTLPLTRCHFQPQVTLLVTKGHEWSGQLNFLNKPVVLKNNLLSMSVMFHSSQENRAKIKKIVHQIMVFFNRVNFTKSRKTVLTNQSS